MSDIAIRVENLSKRYRIGLKEEIHDTFAGALTSFVRSPIKNIQRLRRLSRFEEDGRDPEDVIWALKDVSFEVKRGEVLGIIGRNGAGKSTLLKILSKITYPTTGRVELHGRVSSLLEVGTGFHPELTGRENIYLNGTILGMTRKEIDRKFDEIVDFSGVEKFIDTPVKRYSSGMRVRLAFSVAAYLEPEILLIDEVLAVGDTEFQKKCLGKMDEVAKEGRTVLFVSHNMGSISDLCNRTISLYEGCIIDDGETIDVITNYLKNDNAQGQVDLQNWDMDRIGDGPLRVKYLATRDSRGEIRSIFSHGETLIIEIGILGKAGMVCVIGLSIRDSMGHVILHFINTDDRIKLILPSNEVKVIVHVPKIILSDGYYNITVYLADSLKMLNDRVGNCLSFKVASSKHGDFGSLGLVRIPVKWKITT